MATETRTENDASALSDSMNRVGLNDGGDENRVGPDGEAAPRTDEEYAQSQMTLRAIVSSKEAGVIIGKAGKNVADLRDETGVKAGVSKVVQGVHDRVLTVTGGLDGISKAYAIVAKGLLEGAPQMGMGGVISTNGTHRKLFPSTHMQAADVSLRSWYGFGRVGIKTDVFISHPTSHFSQSNGHDHRSPGTQDQTYPGRLGSPHGGPEGNAPPVYRAYC